MNRLANAAAMLEERSETTLLIRPPRKRLFKIAAVIYLIYLLLFALTVNVFALIVTLPTMFIWAYFYRMFCKIWVSYHYSRFYLVIMPLILTIFGVLLSRFIVSIMSVILTKVFFRLIKGGLL